LRYSELHFLNKKTRVDLVMCILLFRIKPCIKTHVPFLFRFQIADIFDIFITLLILNFMQLKFRVEVEMK